MAKRDVPFTDKQYEDFETQALYACLDANLAFQWTDSEQVMKMFQMCKSSVRMPRRKIVAGRILDRENNIVYEKGIKSLRSVSHCQLSSSLANKNN